MAKSSEHQPRDPTLSASDEPARLDRRTVLGAAGGAMLATGFSSPVLALRASDWKPAVFGRQQLNLVQRLADAIIPRTDTPGAADAQVERFIDLQLSVGSEPDRKRFLEGLEALGRVARSFAGRPVAKLSDDQLKQLLHEVSDDASTKPPRGSDLALARGFFGDLKQRTITGYYTSREGWVEELGLPDGPFTSRFRGCDHQTADHQTAERSEE